MNKVQQIMLWVGLGFVLGLLVGYGDKHYRAGRTSMYVPVEINRHSNSNSRPPSYEAVEGGGSDSEVAPPPYQWK